MTYVNKNSGIVKQYKNFNLIILKCIIIFICQLVYGFKLIASFGNGLIRETGNLLVSRINQSNQQNEYKSN